MYSILQASTLTGVSRDMIRHYEKLGLIKPKRGANRYREYSDSDLYRLVMIRSLNNLGVSLKTLDEAMRGGGVSSVIRQLEAESLRLEAMRSYIAACGAAAELSLSAFRQYDGSQDYAIVHTRKRILYSRESHSSEEYAGVCRQATEANGFFQYYYRQDFRFEAEALRLVREDAVLILYDPLAFELPSVETLEGQSVYQATLLMEEGKLLSEKELLPHLQKARQLCGREALSVFSSQIFQSEQQGNRCVVSIEIPLG